MTARIYLIILSMTSFAVCSNAAYTKDPSSQAISQQELQKGISQTPIESPKQMLLLSRASNSHLADFAYQQYMQILQNNPKNGYANLLAGMAAENDWDYKTNPTTGHLKPYAPEARALFDKMKNFLSQAIRLQPTSPRANAEYGYFLWRYDNATTQGFPYLQKAVQLAPKDSVAHALLGDALSNPYAKVYDPLRAESELQTAIALTPLYAYPHIQLVFLYLIQKNYKDAHTEMDTYLHLSPPDRPESKIVQILQQGINKGLGKN